LIVTKKLAGALFLLWAAVLMACVSSAAEPAASREKVRISIDPDSVQTPITDDFIGFGYESSAVAREGYFSPGNTHLVQLYRTLGPHGLVRIGGNVSDHTRFVPDGTPQVQSEKGTTVINQKVLQEFGDFLRATGWKAMWGLNLGSGSKEEAVQEALAVHRALGDRLQSLEIGNEVDLLPRFKTYEGYYEAYKAYKGAIHSALPQAAFSGPDVAGNTQWAVDFATSECKDLQLLTHHYYRTGARKPEATIETLLAPDPAFQTKLERLQRSCSERGIRFRINEVNSFYGGGKPGVSDTFASALWCLDFMFELASIGCDGVNLETDINQMAWVSHYSPIFRDAAGQLIARPEYYGMLAFALTGKGELLKLTASPTVANLTAYATQSSAGSLWITAVNKDPSRQVTLEVVLPPGHSRAEAYRLAAPSIESQDQVTLAGAQVSAQGAWSPGPAEKIEMSEAVASASPGCQRCPGAFVLKAGVVKRTWADING
jgi:hypothetical protein